MNIEQLKTISAFISKRNIDLVENYLVKNYNSTQEYSRLNSFKVVNSIVEDNLDVLYYTSRFKNIDVGYILLNTIQK